MVAPMAAGAMEEEARAVAGEAEGGGGEGGGVAAARVAPGASAN